MTTIDRNLMLYLESLSNIRLSEEERAACRDDLQSVIDHFGQLAALDTEGVEPMTHGLPLVNVMREDKAVASIGSEALLANAPRVKDGAVMVVRTVE